MSGPCLNRAAHDATTVSLGVFWEAASGGAPRAVLVGYVVQLWRRCSILVEHVGLLWRLLGGAASGVWRILEDVQLLMARTGSGVEAE